MSLVTLHSVCISLCILLQGYKILGHSGYGGSIAYADMTAGVGVAYSTNYLAMYMKDDPRAESLQDAFYGGFETYKAEAAKGRGV